MHGRSEQKEAAVWAHRHAGLCSTDNSSSFDTECSSLFQKLHSDPMHATADLPLTRPASFDAISNWPPFLNSMVSAVIRTISLCRAGISNTRQRRDTDRWPLLHRSPIA